MKNSLMILSVIMLTACSGHNISDSSSDVWVDSAATVAADQLEAAALAIPDSAGFPRSVYTDYSLEQLCEQRECDVDSFRSEVELMRHPDVTKFRRTMMVGTSDWTSGFFPGSLWYAYELTGKPELKVQAMRFTNKLLPVSYQTDTHDLGFMVNCSYGNAYRLAPDDSIKAVVVRTADNLISRFDQSKGVIRSWDFGPWNYPVIIDNMMNLELLFNAWRITGDDKYRNIAVCHANTTMKNHFRPDYSCYHVVSYGNDGTIESKGTFQGKNDSSSWARGQGWALYGFTECARETGDTAYLNQAQHIADMIIERNTAPDKIPYWDFDAPALESTPRDASAAAVIASGMIDMAYQLGEKGDKYMKYALELLRMLATPEYMAANGDNNGFVLKHSTGSLPHGSEIDTPLNYADYYFLEALVRYKRILNGENPVRDNF